MVQVKYLSSPRVLGLQLSDASLRRHFLVQALIFLQACKVPPGKSRGSALKPKQARPQRTQMRLALCMHMFCRHRRHTGSAVKGERCGAVTQLVSQLEPT